MMTVSHAMDNFFTAVDREGLYVHNEVLIGDDVAKDLDSILTYVLPKNKVSLFRSRNDVTKLCREEEKRMKKLTGEPKTIDDEHMIAVFAWNNTIGFVQDIVYPVSRWTRYFQADINSPCLICMENKIKRTMCSNCASIICLDCDTRIGTDICPVCTKQMSSFR